MTREEAIDFGEDRLGLFGGKMEEFIKLSMEELKEQRPKGHWIDHPQGEQCSECGLYVKNRHNDNYCPYCGADMSEEIENARPNEHI